MGRFETGMKFKRAMRRGTREVACGGVP